MNLPRFLLWVTDFIAQFAKSAIFQIGIIGGLSCVGVIAVPYIIRYFIDLRRR